MEDHGCPLDARIYSTIVGKLGKLGAVARAEAMGCLMQEAGSKGTKS